MTLLQCTRCDKPACHECLTQAAVGSQCKGCVKEAQIGFKDLAGRQAKAVKRTVKPSPIFGALLLAWIASGVLIWTAPQVRVGVFAFVLIGWIVSLCLHEFAHAFTAFIGGDGSVVSKGYLTLDPRKYTDPGLSLLFPLVFLLIGGIGLPGGAVWIQRNAIRTKRMESLMSLAGPFSNLILAFLLLLPGRFDWYSGSAGKASFYFALEFLGRLQLGAFVLNMLPIPGFDGFGAIEPFLPAGLLRSIAPYRQYGPLIFLFVLISGSRFGTQLWDTIDGLFTVFGGDSGAASFGSVLFRFWDPDWAVAQEILANGLGRD
jgi:Zn-dependent protease